jgi:hypothetical protein
MDSKNLEQLLEKYWKCETSLEEEKLLRDYFSGNEVSESLKDTAVLFKYFEAERLRTTSEEVEQYVTKEIKKRQGGKIISMLSIHRMARIAAGVLVVVAATYFVRQEIRKSYPPEIEGTITDPELALEETKKALMMISRGFGKAREGASKINLLNEAEEKISGKEKEEPKEKINI